MNWDKLLSALGNLAAAVFITMFAGWPSFSLAIIWVVLYAMNTVDGFRARLDRGLTLLEAILKEVKKP